MTVVAVTVPAADHQHHMPLIAAAAGWSLGLVATVGGIVANLTTSEVAIIVPTITGGLSLAGALILDRHRPRNDNQVDCELRHLRDRIRELEADDDPEGVLP